MSVHFEAGHAQLPAHMYFRSHLVNNMIGDEGAMFIAKLTNLTSLFIGNRSLRLGKNGITDQGAKHLQSLKQLDTLYLCTY